MKILYINNFYQQQGGENIWFESEPNLFKAQGHEVITFKRDNHEINEYPPLKQASLLWKTTWSQESYEAVRSLIRSERPDVAHVHNTLPLVTPSVYYACHAESVPVVQTIHNYRLLCPEGNFLRKGEVCEECLDHSLWRSVIYGCYRGSRIQSSALAWMLATHRRRGTWQNLINRFLVPTEFLKQKLIQGGLKAEKISIKPNWYEPDPGPREPSDGSVLYAGRLSEEKGVKTLLKAWTEVQNPPILKILGDGPLREEVERAANSNARISYLARRSPAEVIEYMRRANILVIPSEWYEAFPHSIVEAYACSLPIIASRIGTLNDVVKDGETGLLFDPGNASDLAAKVKWMFEHPAAATQMSTNARAEYEANYTGSHVYRILLDAYTSVCKQPATAMTQTT